MNSKTLLFALMIVLTMSLHQLKEGEQHEYSTNTQGSPLCRDYAGRGDGWCAIYCDNIGPPWVYWCWTGNGGQGCDRDYDCSQYRTCGSLCTSFHMPGFN